MRILIAEDEVSIAKALKVMLEKNKYAVDVAHNGLDALDAIFQVGYDLLVLDIMMPGMNGLDVLKTARAQGVTAPALFLTAKSEIEDRVAGLDAGADDYLPKPFAASEFLARVRALIRRSSSYAPTILSFGNVQLNCSQYELSARGQNVPLNNKEYQLMELLIRNPRCVLSTGHLMERVWGMDTDTEVDVVWTYIGFLRKKLKQIGADVEIRTVRGAGYALEEIKC